MQNCVSIKKSSQSLNWYQMSELLEQVLKFNKTSIKKEKRRKIYLRFCLKKKSFFLKKKLRDASFP